MILELRQENEERAFIKCDCEELDVRKCVPCIVKILVAARKKGLRVRALTVESQVGRFELEGGPLSNYVEAVDPVKLARTLSRARRCARCDLLYSKVRRRISEVIFNPKKLYKFLSLIECSCDFGNTCSKAKEKLEKLVDMNLLKGGYELVLAPKEMAFKERYVHLRANGTKLLEERVMGYTYTYLQGEGSTFCRVTPPSGGKGLIEKAVEILRSRREFDIEAPLDDILKFRWEEAKRILLHDGIEVKPEELEWLALETAIRSTKFGDLFPYLINHQITELYGTLGRPFYLDHVQLGRCFSDLVLTDRLFEKLLTVVELSNARLDISSPSARVEVRNSFFSIRLGLDIEPFSVPPSVNIRNLAAIRHLSIARLVELGMFSRPVAAYLMQLFCEGANMLIVGPTGAGKTTLANALIAVANPRWRIIAIESIMELEDHRENGKLFHQHTVPPTEAKEGALISLLQRNPDLLFQGEVLTRTDAEAFVFGAESGFQMLATTHARSPYALREKWRKWGVDISPLDGCRIVQLSKEAGSSGRVTRRIEGIYVVKKRGLQKDTPKPSPLYSELLETLLLAEARTNREAARIVNAWWEASG